MVLCISIQQAADLALPTAPCSERRPGRCILSISRQVRRCDGSRQTPMAASVPGAMRCPDDGRKRSGGTRSNRTAFSIRVGVPQIFNQWRCSISFKSTCLQTAPRTFSRIRMSWLRSLITMTVLCSRSWMSETIDLGKEKNFFESRVTEHRSGASLSWD